MGDPSGLLPGDEYKSAEAAAKDASDFARRYRNEHDDTEVGRYIYQNPDGSWSYTFTVGEPTSVDQRKAPPPSGSRHQRRWHTHPYKKGGRPSKHSEEGTYDDPRTPSISDLNTLFFSADGVAYIMLSDGTIIELTMNPRKGPTDPGYSSSTLRGPSPLPPLKGKLPPNYRPPSLGGGVR